MWQHCQSLHLRLNSPIIGGALGGLSLLAIAFMAFMFFRRKRNDDRSHHGEPTPTINSSRKFLVPPFHVHVVELKPLQVWTSIPRANVDVVPAHTTLTEKQPLVPVSTPSSNTTQNNTPTPGLHAHYASASSPSGPAPASTDTSNQVSDSTTIPSQDLPPPQYEA
jgi:hypothetical protein